MYVENVVLATRLGIRAVLVLEQVCHPFRVPKSFEANHLLFIYFGILCMLYGTARQASYGSFSASSKIKLLLAFYR